MTFYGQHGEDAYIKTLFPDNYIGTCIEVGAYDGISLSNTYFFEQKGWKSLCIEPLFQFLLINVLKLEKNVINVVYLKMILKIKNLLFFIYMIIYVQYLH